MANINNNVSYRRPSKNNFNLSHERLMTGQIGKLHVVDRYPVTAGDRFDSGLSYLMLFEPLATPAMVRMNVHFHAFFVPNRIITPSTSRDSIWERHFLSLGRESKDVPILPYLTGSRALDFDFFTDEDHIKKVTFTYEDWSVGSLADDLGLNVYTYDEFQDGVSAGKRFRLPSSGISLLPFLGYHRIYQDFYRRDQIEREMALPLNLGRCDISNILEWEYDEDDRVNDPLLHVDKFDPKRLFRLETRNYERDYFTSALPEPQFGDDVVVGDGQVGLQPNTDGIIHLRNFMLSSSPGVNGNTNFVDGVISVNSSPQYLHTVTNAVIGFDQPAVNDGLAITGIENVFANTFTINELRLAMQLQGVREKINRGGTRYLEMMRTIYGVTIPDARLQRAQFLGGATFPVTIGQVLQTSETAETPQGTRVGNGTSAGGQGLFRSKFEFVEPGQVYVIMSVTPRTSYMGGTPKDFLFKYPEDWYVPDFDHLGEEEIKVSELASEYLTTFDQFTYDHRQDLTFGYTPRYSYYKQGHSTATGTFRNIDDTWSVTREFTFFPTLNTSFIKADKEDFERIFAVQNVEHDPVVHFKAQIVHSLRGKRPMSKYSTPFTFY